MTMTFRTVCTEKNQLLDVWFEDLSIKIGEVVVEWFVEFEVREQGIKTTNVSLTKLTIDGNLADSSKIVIDRDTDVGSIIPSVELDDDGTIQVIFK